MLIVGHYSKDTETVPWHEDCALDGAVETYLANLETHLRAMLRDILENARHAAENWEVVERARAHKYWSVSRHSVMIIWTVITNFGFTILGCASAIE